jgi:hypothetical protein
MLRPKAEVLPESAQVPARNLVVPPPTRFTHELARPQPYYYASPRPGAAPVGEFKAGTKVVLLRRAGKGYSRVVDGRGLKVCTATDGLRPLA